MNRNLTFKNQPSVKHFLGEILEALKTSLANKTCDNSDVTHGQKLPRPKSDVMTMDDVSHQPRIID